MSSAWRLGSRLGRPGRLAAAGAAAYTFTVMQQQPPAHNQWFGSKEKNSLHLRYFDVKGSAETARLLMTLGGQKWSDDRWPIDFSKPREEMSQGFTEAIAAGLLAANLDRAPVLVVDGSHEIGQSKSIERYLARRLHLLGSNDIEAAKIDAFTEHIRDVRDKYIKAKGQMSEEARRTALAEFFSKTLPNLFGLMERVCDGSSSTGAIIGKQLSYADCCLFVLVEDFFENRQGVHEAIASCPKLRASTKAFAQHPAIAKYLADRPDTKV